MMMTEKKRAGYGQGRLDRILGEKGTTVEPFTVPYVLKHHKLSINYKRSGSRSRNRFYNFEELFFLQHLQVDLKEVYNATKLSKEVLSWAKGLNISPYQLTATDVKTKLGSIYYFDEKTLTKRLLFMLTPICFLRSFGVEHKIATQTDNGEDFVGDMYLKEQPLALAPRREPKNPFLCFFQIWFKT